MKNYGLKIDRIKDTDYIFGSSPIPYEEINPSGDWTEFLPNREEQNLGLFETYACVSFTILNCIEALIKKQYGEERNYSDRFLAGISGTKEGGNSPVIVADFLRRFGVVPQDILPFTKDIKSLDEFYSPILKELYDIAEEFFNEFDFKFELVPDDKEQIKKALKCSPLLVSVCAWFHNGKIYYKPDGMTDNHATTLISIKEKEYQRIFDSYADGEGDPFIKDYDWKAPHMIIMRFWIKRKKKQTMNITQKLLPISLRRSGQKLLGVKFLVAHDTANSGTTARQNVDYYIKSANATEASTHYFVDDKEIIQCIPDNEKAWQVRYSTTKDNEIYGKDANSWALGIELCFGGKIDSEKAYQNYIQLIADLCRQYGLNPEKQIVGHYTLDPARRNDPLNAFSFMKKTWTGFIYDVSSLVSKPLNDDLIKCEEELETQKTLLQKMWAYIMDILAKR